MLVLFILKRQEMIMKFFDTPSEMILIIQLSPTGVLVPFLEISATGRVKASYFIKRSPAKITRENYRDVIIPGDMAPRPIDELSVLFEEVASRICPLELHIVRVCKKKEIDAKRSRRLARMFCLGLRADIVESEESQGLAARHRRGHEETRLRFSQHNMPGTRSCFCSP